jgi:predicted ABC-type sugar transport system permease subunit
MSFLIPFMVVVVVGFGFVIERSSMTKNMKAVSRLAVLGIVLAITFYWVRATVVAS